MNEVTSADRTRTIGVYIPVDEAEEFDEICKYFGINKTKLMRAMIDYLYRKVILEEFDIDLDEIASTYNIGYGVLADIFNVYE